MGLFTPETYVDSIFEITPAFMKARGLSALLVDIDDTLSAHGELTPSEEVIEWAGALKGAGYPLVAFSNNHEERVAPFAESLGIPFVFEAGKPLPGRYAEALKTIGFGKKQVAMVGDQIFTDMLGANLAGIRSVLVLTEERSVYGFTRLKRVVERMIVKKLKRRAKA